MPATTEPGSVSTKCVAASGVMVMAGVVIASEGSMLSASVIVGVPDLVNANALPKTCCPASKVVNVYGVGMVAPELESLLLIVTVPR